MLRKIDKTYVWNEFWDKLRGWDKADLKPVYTDPVIDVSAYLMPPPVWEQDGMVIHENRGTMPILMSDGHVLALNRSGYPTPVWGTILDSTFTIIIDDIIGR